MITENRVTKTDDDLIYTLLLIKEQVNTSSFKVIQDFLKVMEQSVWCSQIRL